MDVAYNQHSERARRKNRSSTNINHLSLAPLTAKLPLNDSDAIPDSAYSQPPPSISYMQGKSAPTTPRLFTRAPATPRSRSHHRTPSAPSGTIPKSKSSTHLDAPRGRKSASGTTTPKRRKGDTLGPKELNDEDWLLRTGVFMSTEAREFKGQAWLVSRQSSTSLAGMPDAEEQAFEQELARERELASRHASRRGSSAMADDDMTPNESRHHSRFTSRKHSMADSHRITPFEFEGGDSYFPTTESISGPDFVNLDEKLEELEQDTTQDDEAAIRRLVKYGHRGQGSWISNVIGWSLFSVDENGEDSDDDDESLGEEIQDRSGSSSRHFIGISTAAEDRVPPPAANEGGWKDAAWLLSVASKVVF